MADEDPAAAAVHGAPAQLGDDPGDGALIVVLSERADSTARGIAAALRRALEPEAESSARLSSQATLSPIALPAADGDGPIRLAGVDVALALDAPSARRAREEGVPVVLLLAPFFDLDDEDLEADRVLVPHAAMVAEAVSRGVRRDHVLVAGPVAPFGWAPAADRGALRVELGLRSDAPWVVVRAEALDRADLAPMLVHLSLVRRDVQWLFDVGRDPDLARSLRRRVPGYGLDAVMLADGPEGRSAYQAADLVLGLLEGPGAVRAFAVGAAFVALPPRRHQLRLASVLEAAGLVTVVDAAATLAVTLDAALTPDALERGKQASLALGASDGAARVAALVRGLGRGAAGEPPLPAGLPRGLERLSERDEAAESKPWPEPKRAPDEDGDIDRELAALREKLGL